MDVKKTDSGSEEPKPQDDHTTTTGYDVPPPSYTETVGANIALNTDFLSHHPLTLFVNGEAFTRDMQVVDSTGKTILRIDCPTFSTSHEMTIIHAESGNSLFTISKKQFSMSWRYSAELPPQGSGKTLFDTETSPGFFGSGQTYMNFRNAMTGEMDRLEVDLHRWSGPNEVKYKGKKIADIEKEGFTMGTKWCLNIHEPGIDPLLIVVLTLVISDRLRTQRRRRA